MPPDDGKRKYLPAEAYRFLVLAALATPGSRTTKGRLAWETRANHYMIGRVLSELHQARHVEVDGNAQTGYEVHATDAGRAFWVANREYFLTTFGARVRQHFRFGRRPSWLPVSETRGD